MADTKISALTAAAAAAAANEFAINEAGTSKKVTGTQLKTFMQTMTAPSVISVGAEFTSTAIPTATLPGTHATNDILVLCIQQSNEAIYAVPSGYTRIGPSNGLGTAITAGATKLSLFWKRDNGAEGAPTLTDSGDHTYGVMFAVRGCPTVGDPFVIGGMNWKFTTSTAGASPTSVSSGSNRLIVDIFATSIDIATAQGSALTNADLTSLTEQFDDGTTDGTGGTIYISSGVKAVAGPIVATTVTWATTSTEVCTRLHFLPSDDEPDHASRGPEIQIFIGSATDLDDTWVKPYGAKKVFAQTMDGGGGGSGGNTTTTAAGGGAGGGGGYDEAWFNAGDLAATITVHAGKGAAAGTALLQAGNLGTLSEFDKGGNGPLISRWRVLGTAATAAASADGGNGGCGSGRGVTSPTASASRLDMYSTANPVSQGYGGRGGAGTTAPVGGGNADWGGGGGESGADTDAAITAIANGWSLRGAGGGSGGRTNTNISQPGHGGGAASTFAAQGAEGAASTRLPYGGAGGVGGGSSVVVGGAGGFPGGGGGGGAGVAGGFGGRGGHGMVVVTTYF